MESQAHIDLVKIAYQYISEKIEEELGESPTVVATGGLSRDIIEHCKTNIIYNENFL